MKKTIYIIIFFMMIFAGYVSADDFVITQGTEFRLNGKPFYFAGANNYYLFYKPLSNLVEVLDDAENLGLTVIRTWGFCDGSYSYSFQTAPGVYSEARFQWFDRIIKEASDRGIRLIVPLVNNWDDFGGMCQYVKWCGLTDASLCDADEPWPFGLPTEVHDKFYTDSCTKNLYKQYAAYFLNRTNTLTGIKYKDDPTIFAWELANEPRCRSDTTTATLNNWIGEMSAYIKSIDSNHLVTPGGDGGYKNKASDPTWSWWYHGNEGQDFIGNHQWPGVDFSTFRHYPEAGKFDDVDVNLWIQQHVEDSHNVIGKPVIMEEFGSQLNKVTDFTNYYNQLETRGANGDTLWLLADHLKPGNDGYFISCPEDAVCSVISAHADHMDNLNNYCLNDNDCNYLDENYCSSDLVKHDEGKCISNQCQIETTTTQDCNSLDNDYCDGILIKHDDYTCNAASCVLGSTTTLQSCDDGLYCNGAETCSVGSCVSGTPVDCSGNDLSTIGTCSNNPDNNIFTWDYFAGFTSVCDEANNICTSGSVNLIHSCDINQCSAECEIDDDCDDGNSMTLDTCSACVCDHQYIGNCTIPVDGMQLVENTTLCPGSYNLLSGFSVGAGDSGKIEVDCNNALIYGNGTGTGVFLDGNYKTLTNCKIENYSTGISLSDYNTISNNILTGNEYGVRFANHDIMEENAVIGGSYSFFGWHSGQNTFLNNVLKDSTYGFYLHDSPNNYFGSNNISGCSTGIHIWWYSWNNNFNDNIIENCGDGVYFDWHSGSNDFKRNTVRNNYRGFNHPAEWWGTIYHNEFYSNEIDNNTYGMYLSNSEDMIIKDNTISNNLHSINVPYAHNNLIYRNNFINNTNQAPTSTGNTWYYNQEGNYWNNYDEPSEGCNDADSNLRCDDPYGDPLKDYYPLTEKDGWLMINHPPVLSFIEDIFAVETDLVWIIADSVDPDSGDPRILSINDSRFVQNRSNSFTWQTNIGDAGFYAVRVTVSDGELNDSQDVYITVLDAGVICITDSDCPGSSYSESYCGSDNNVYHNYTSYTCINPGTFASECQATATPQLLETCDYACDDAACLTDDVSLIVSTSYKALLNETSDVSAYLGNNGEEDTDVTLITYDVYNSKSVSIPYNITGTITFEGLVYNVTRYMLDNYHSRIIVNGDEFILFRRQMIELDEGIFLGYTSSGSILISRPDVSSVQVNNLAAGEYRSVNLGWIPRTVGYRTLFVFANVTDDVLMYNNFEEKLAKAIYNAPEVDIELHMPFSVPLNDPVEPTVLCAKNEGGMNASFPTMFYDLYDYANKRIYYNTTETLEFDGIDYNIDAYKLDDENVQLLIDGQEVIIFRDKIVQFNEIFAAASFVDTSYVDIFLGNADVTELETINISVGGSVCYPIDLTWTPKTTGAHHLFVFANQTGDADIYDNYKKANTNVYFDGECLVDSDCGEDGLLNNNYCNGDDVWDTYRTYTCNNPGTSSATCTFTDAGQLKETCADTCDTGVCVITCTEDWLVQYGLCQTNDQKLKYYIDNNSCGTEDNLPIDNGTYVVCDYCEYSIANTTWSSWQDMGLCQTDDTKDQNRSRIEYDGNYETCYSITLLSSDLWNSGNNNTHWEFQSINCDYCTPDWQPYNTSCNGTHIIEYYLDDNDCYSETGLASDLVGRPANKTYLCNITCSLNSDCGTNGFIGDNYCYTDEVRRDAITFTCHNPGTVSSYCSNATDFQLIEVCSDNCMGGQCIEDIECSDDSDCGTDGLIGNAYCSLGDSWQDYRSYTCNNAGTASSYCSHEDTYQLIEDCSGECINGSCASVNCSNDSDCGVNSWLGLPYCNSEDVYQSYRVWTCNNPGTASSYCSYSDNGELKEACDASCVDGACVDENNETNSTSDLKVQYFVLQTPNPTAGNAVVLAFYLKNTGDDTLSSIDWSLSTGGGAIINGVVSELDAGKGTVIMRKTTYSTAGTYDAKISIDPMDKIAESDESNNEYEITVEVV